MGVHSSRLYLPITEPIFQEGYFKSARICGSDDFYYLAEQNRSLNDEVPWVLFVVLGLEDKGSAGWNQPLIIHIEEGAREIGFQRKAGS